MTAGYAQSLRTARASLDRQDGTNEHFRNVENWSARATLPIAPFECTIRYVRLCM